MESPAGRKSGMLNSPRQTYSLTSPQARNLLSSPTSRLEEASPLSRSAVLPSPLGRFNSPSWRGSVHSPARRPHFPDAQSRQSWRKNLRRLVIFVLVCVVVQLVLFFSGRAPSSGKLRGEGSDLLTRPLLKPFNKSINAESSVFNAEADQAVKRMNLDSTVARAIEEETGSPNETVLPIKELQSSEDSKASSLEEGNSIAEATAGPQLKQDTEVTSEMLQSMLDLLSQTNEVANLAKGTVNTTGEVTEDPSVQAKAADEEGLRQEQAEAAKLTELKRVEEDNTEMERGLAQECAASGYCVWGRGLAEVLVMDHATFFIRVKSSEDICYVRATGSAILVPKLTRLSKGDANLLRADYMPQQEGDYQWWIYCKGASNSWAEGGAVPAIPAEAGTVPWNHPAAIPGVPFSLHVKPNPEVPPRGCAPCWGNPTAGVLLGQWIDVVSLHAECGGQAVGAASEWFEDKYVWAARQCSYPFPSREDFLRQFDGANIILFGDSSVRGMFCNLQNWLYRKLGPDFLQGETYSYNHADRSSSWDGLVCGFNAPPNAAAFHIVEPNPFQVGNVRVRYFGVDHAEGYEGGWKPLQQMWETEAKIAGFHYTVVLTNYGLWSMMKDSIPGMEGQPLTSAVPAFIRQFLQHVKCRQGEGQYGLVPTSAEETCGDSPSAEAVGIENAEGCCKEHFPGRVVYRSLTGKFDWPSICIGANEGKVCELHEQAIQPMLRESFATNTWERTSLLLQDTFDMTYARPDRSVDSFHFFPRKCSAVGMSCNKETKDPNGCCWPANAWASSASATMTNLFINLLWNDPMLLDRKPR